MSEARKGGGQGGPHLSPEDRAALERRVAGLDKRLSDVKSRDAAEAKASRDRRSSSRGMAYGLRMASELVAAVLVGGVIGYGFDQWLGTTPWLFLPLVILGFVAGVRNVMRGYQKVQAEVAASTGGNIGKAVPDDDEDA
jgi:ATP synthase protein I